MNLQHIGHYRLLKKLGRGGMGDVYQAQDLRLNRYVAVKIFPPQYSSDEQRVLRFVQEAQLASAINHPNVLTIHDLGEEGGTHYLVTEFVDGETLRRRLQRGALAHSETVAIAIGAARALDAAHDYWVVHRDIKPENVMIRCDGLVKILDFGLAKALENPLFASGGPRVETSPGMVPGTIWYAPPERLRGEAADPRSDLFSLGCVIYEMISGRAPFGGDSLMQVMERILRQEPESLERARPDTPEQLSCITRRLMRKDPEDRYQTAHEVIDELVILERDLQRQNNHSPQDVDNQ